MQVCLVRALELIDADHFNDSYRYRFVGVFDTQAGAMLRSFTVPSDLRDWPQCHMGGWPLFKVETVETGGLAAAEKLRQSFEAHLRKDVRHAGDD